MALEVLHGDEVPAVVLADLVGVDDVGVGEARGEARLVEEHGGDEGVLGERGAEALDHHELAPAHGPLRRGEENVGHAAAANVGEHPILSGDKGVVLRRHGRTPCLVVRDRAPVAIAKNCPHSPIKLRAPPVRGKTR